MTSSHWTPSFQHPSRPTPASAASNRPQKAPIYNPYDKFSQNEFDSWIGNITGALRKALGQDGEEEEEFVVPAHAADLLATRDNEISEVATDHSETEDSFAELKIRRDKGKARDPREGPGLGGDRLQPIELLYSGSEEEEDGEGEEEIEEVESDWREYDSDGGRYSEGVYDGSEEEDGENEPSGHRDNGKSKPGDIIELSSEEEGENEDQLFDGEYEYEDEDDDVDRRSSPDVQHTLDVAKLQTDSVEGDEEDGFAEDVEYDEEAFPPRRAPSQPPDLVDPWTGPQTYAEDFYSGGDVREGVLDPTLASPSHLTPVHDERIWDDDAERPLPQTPDRKEPAAIDVDMDEDEQDVTLLIGLSPVTSSLVEESHVRGEKYDDENEREGHRIFDEVDAFLDEGSGGRLPSETEFATPPPEVVVHTQPHTTQLDTMPIDIPVPPIRTLSPPAASNGQMDWNWTSAPGFAVEHVTSGIAESSTPLKSAPEVIEVEDDEEGGSEDEQDEIDENDDYGDPSDLAEVHELSSEVEDEDEEGSGTTRDLIKDFLPLAHYDFGPHQAPDEDVVEVVENTAVEPAAVEPFPVEDEPEEVEGFAKDDDTVTFADQESTVHDMKDDLDMISADASEKHEVEEMDKASSDIPSLADTVKGPVWDDDTPQDFPEPTARQSTPPLTETETVQATDLVDPSINTGIVPENTESLSDITPHVESNSFDEATSGTKVHESLEVPNESNERTRDISVETTGQEMHYTVSEVMTDDVARSTAPLEDRDMDIVSVADDQGGEVIPYIIEEPVTEGRLTEEPSDRDVIKESSADIIIEFAGQVEDDSGPIPSASETISNLALADTSEVKLGLLEDINSSHEVASGVAPLNNGDEDKQSAESGQSEHISAMTSQHIEPHGKEHEMFDAFPMPVSADPSVPDPIDVRHTFKAHINPPASENPLDSAVVAPDLVDDATRTSLTGQPPFIDIMSRQESLSSASASGLFTPQTETMAAPETTGTQSIDPSIMADSIHLMDSVDAEHSTAPILDVSSVPSEKMDGMEILNEAISIDTLSGTSMDANNMSLRSPPSSRITGFPVSVEKEDDPFKLMGSDSKVAPGPVDSGSSSGDSNAEQLFDSFSRGDDQPYLSEVHASGDLQSNGLSNGTNIQLGDDQAMPTESLSQNGARIHSGGPDRTKSLDSIGTQPLRRTKRKRASSMNTGEMVMSVDYKGKGKAKAVNQDGARTEDSPTLDAASENGSSGSGDTVAKMLHLSSWNTSRASSVASNAESALSNQQSPSLRRQVSSTNGQNKVPTLFHVHSGLHRDRHPEPSIATQSSRPRNLKRSVSSSSQIKDESATQPSPSQRTAVMHSPVTRSMCRFHRVSLPQEENGPRVSFVMPGCSLGNKTLMDDEGIVDHGDATTLDHERMVGDIETLDFSSQLLGVLRQLVGVDLLRENEVFFLPRPGESYRRKRHGKPKLTVAKTSSADLAAPVSPQSTTSSLRGSTSRVVLGPPVLRASLSMGGSTSTSTGSIRVMARGSERHSTLTDDELTETEPEDNLSQTKRRRESVSTKQSGVASSEEMPPPASSAMSKQTSAKQHRLTARRSKRLSLDAHAYKPTPEAEETSTDQDNEVTKGRRKRAAKRGVKRNRTSEVIDLEGKSDERTSKRSRVRPSASSKGAGQNMK